MDKQSGIYLITNLINGHLYVGKSKDIHHRWIGHCSEAKTGKSNAPLECAIRKYGKENFSIQIIENIPMELYDKLSDEREQYWISYYNTYKNKNHYNATEGGDKGRSGPLSEEHKQKISEGLKRYYQSPEGQERARQQSIEGKGKAFFQGHKHTDEWKEQHSIDMQGEKNPAYGTHTNGRKVYCVELDKTFESIRSAAKAVGISHGGISAVLAGRQKIAGGYHWEYI